ncbi:MAG: hypothetical protein SPL19_09775 [Fibrobacter sp.]|nr:hypothetical protein [Fibrobacter sp.]MDY6369785.1 hypothetical protein [Fibrobacter sp.]MDY6390635.1 hypothetical protein [Fibrobacter sp.]
MWVILFKTLEGVDYYGDRPDALEDDDPRGEFYGFDIDRQYWNNLEADFIDPVDALCGTLLFSSTENLRLWGRAYSMSPALYATIVIKAPLSVQQKTLYNSLNVLKNVRFREL